MIHGAWLKAKTSPVNNVYQLLILQHLFASMPTDSIDAVMTDC